MSNGLEILRKMGCDVENVRFRITIKRDFGSGKGFLIDGEWVKTGYVVTAFGCNVIPGAGWFETVADAMIGIRALIESWQTDVSFHRIYRRMLDEAYPEEAEAKRVKAESDAKRFGISHTVIDYGNGDTEVIRYVH